MTITREELYELVWTASALDLGPRLGISATYLARVCKALDVPRPSLGYWAKRQAGKAPPAPPLPPLRPGAPTSWVKGKTVGSSWRQSVPPARTVLQVDRTPVRRGLHQLVRDALPYFDIAEAGHDGHYLKPRKKLVADIMTTKACLQRSFGFANELFHQLESLGYPVMLAQRDEVLIRTSVDALEDPLRDDAKVDNPPPHWSPLFPTVAYFHGVPIGLAVVETSETVTLRYVGLGEYVREEDYRPDEHVPPTWKVWKSFPTGRLKFVAYSPFHDVPWRREWLETRTSLLTGTTLAIARVLESAAIDLNLRLDKTKRFSC